MDSHIKTEELVRAFLNSTNSSDCNERLIDLLLQEGIYIRETRMLIEPSRHMKLTIDLEAYIP